MLVLGQLCIIEAAFEVRDVNAVVGGRLLKVLLQVVNYESLTEVTPKQAQVLNREVAIELNMLA